MNRPRSPFFLALLIAFASAATVAAEVVPAAADTPAPSLAADAPAANAPANVAATDPLPAIQQRWAEIKYQLTEDARADAYAALHADIAAQRVEHPDDLRLAIWAGITLASEAGARGGLGALSLVKQAKAEFEQVIASDGAVLDGSAYTSLGSLYYQVPGWPIGFGDEDKAREMLGKGLAIAPDGIDANYFYGDFLLDQGDYQGAVGALQKALAAPDRPGREQADAGRREEARAALAKAQKKLR